ncbi:MAG: DUF3179 domain-containing (seleno)protein [Saprospiraceae bacterium]
MRKWVFYLAALGLAAFEFFNVYFIMPMPGSQEINSIDVAYFLFTRRWLFRFLFSVGMLYGLAGFFKMGRNWMAWGMLILLAGAVYYINQNMSADHMFLQPVNLEFKNQADNKVSLDRVVMGVTHQGQAKAYPIQYLIYHHQVLDQVGGQELMMTYCSVCRTGRVYVPEVKGVHEEFRLVGMDHYNAMFEDQRTGSWWRQSNGTAITGPLKGEMLVEYPSHQMTLRKWLELYPESLIMQEDLTFKSKFDSLARFENGKSKSRLTRRDSLSWQMKSWVVGVVMDTLAKAYDWNDLVRLRIINDQIGNKHIGIALDSDNKSFIAFERPEKIQITLDSLGHIEHGGHLFDFLGHSMSDSISDLNIIQSYQEFWGSWMAFHPGTTRYDASHRME